jgi:lysophospholipase L1-like esterase
MQNTKHLVALGLALLGLSACGAAVAGPDVGGAAQELGVDVEPRAVTVRSEGNVTFAAAVTGAVDTGVTWSVLESSGGTIDATGKYLAPATTGSFHVVATSKADATKSGQASVSVVPAAPPGVKPTAMELISRTVPATSSSGTASYAQDALYQGPLWGGHVADLGSSTNSWLVYDLSGVPSAKRQSILVALDMAKGDQYYQLNFRAASYTPEFTPSGYVLEGATASAGPWTTLVSVPTNANPFKSHLIAFGSYTFLRLRITSAPNGAYAKMDVYNAAAGLTDGWAFFGDSITCNQFSGGSFPQQWFSKAIQASAPAYFPFVVGGGYPYTTAADAVDLIVNDSGASFSTGLPSPLAAVFKDTRYAALIFGANDAPAQSLVNAFRANYTTIIKRLRQNGQIVVIAAPTWATDTTRQAGLVQVRGIIGFQLPAWAAKTYAAGDYVWNGTHAYRCTTAGNSVTGPIGTGTGIADAGSARWSYQPTLREDFASDPGVMGGPDLYTLFVNHSDWLQDGLHPNATGQTQWVNAWVNWAKATLYQ